MSGTPSSSLGWGYSLRPAHGDGMKESRDSCMLYGRRPTAKEGPGDDIYWTGCTQKGKCLLLPGREWEGNRGRTVVSQPGCCQGVDRCRRGGYSCGSGGDGELAARGGNAGIGGGGGGAIPSSAYAGHCIGEGEDGCYRRSYTCGSIEGRAVAAGIPGASGDTGVAPSGADPCVPGGNTHSFQESGVRGVDPGWVDTLCDGHLRASWQGVDDGTGATSWGQGGRGHSACGDRPLLGDCEAGGEGVAEATGVVQGVPSLEYHSRVRPRHQCDLSGRGGRRVAVQACSTPAVLPGYCAQGAFLSGGKTRFGRLTKEGPPLARNVLV